MGLYWQASTEDSAKGLMALWTHELGSVTRVLVADAEDRNLVITTTLDARKGTTTSLLVDDASGWWARLQIQHPKPSETLGKFFRDAESVTEVRVLLSWQDGKTDSIEQAVDQTLDRMAHRFLDRLQEREGVGSLVETVPRQLIPSILFLEANLSPESSIHAENPNASFGYTVRGVIEVLAQALERSAVAESGKSGRGAEQHWTMKAGEMRKGHLIAAPDLLEITARFQTIENVDPLSDLPLETLFGRISADL